MNFKIMLEWLMDLMKPLQVYLPEHAHRALRILAINEGTTASRMVLNALDKVYPTLQVNSLQRNESLLFRPKGGV